MHRIDGQNHVSNMFSGGDPLIPRSATHCTPAWFNSVQEEIAHVVEQGGQTLSKLDNGQLWAALVARFGHLGTANTWSGNQSFGGAVTVTGTTTSAGAITSNGGIKVNLSPPTSGTGFAPLAYVDIGDIATTANSSYPAFTFRAKVPSANAYGLTVRTRNKQTVTDWYHTQVGFTFDVGSTVGAGGYFYLGDGGAVLGVGANGLFPPSTANIPSVALKLEGGHLSMDGVVAPASSVAMKNAYTSGNIVQAWATFTLGASGPTLNDGYNIASVTNADTNAVLVTFAQPFANANYACSYDTTFSEIDPRTSVKTASTLRIVAKDSTGAVKPIGSGVTTGATQLSVTIVGRM